MSIDANRALPHRFFAEQDRLRGGPAEDMLASGYGITINANPPMDLDGHRQFAQMFYAAFPDLRHEVVDVVTEETKVAVHFQLIGTQRGEFMGIPASGRSMRVDAFAVMNVADGRITSVRGVFDQLTLMQQLGAVGV